MKARDFLVSLKLSGRLVVVVGSSEETARRAVRLWESGAKLSLISPEPPASLRALAAEDGVTLLERAFRDTDLDGAWLSVLVDRDAALAAQMQRAAEARRLFFCAIDQPAFGSFSHPAIARDGALNIAIATEGKAPALARRLREELERLLQAARAAAFVESLSALRAKTPSQDRPRILNEAVASVRFTGELEMPPRDGPLGGPEGA